MDPTVVLALALATLGAQAFHGIHAVDNLGEPFACARLTTVNQITFETDDDGWVAVHEPGLMGEDVWLMPVGEGLIAPRDFLGVEGVAVRLTEGGVTQLVFDRSGASPPCGNGDREQRLLARPVPTAAELHEFRVLDAATGGPVAAVRLTVDGREYWTDSGGRVAWFDLDDMEQPREVAVWTHGYKHTPGAISATPRPGERTEILIDRVNIAERLIRLTGAGIWRDSVMLGYEVPLAEPLLDSKVMGQDTTHVTPWRGELFWLWGDTNKPSYLLGNFNAAGARSAIEATPEDGIDFDYLEAPDGFVKPIAPRFQCCPVWLGGLSALSDNELWAYFQNIDSDFSVIRDGMVRWNDEIEEFEVALLWQEGDVAHPDSSPAIIVDDANDIPWVIYRGGYRVPAFARAMRDRTRYQAWTPLRPDGNGGYAAQRDARGRPIWAWHNDAPVPTVDMPFGLELSPWHQTLEPDTGETPTMHLGGVVSWNPYRGRWIHIYTENIGGPSWLGEIWYAEGDSPVGPWTWTRKIITHDNYSFYNPMLHPWFASDGGRRVLFEGTYTNWLGVQAPTPRYDYNQQFYALQLDDPRLAVPVPFYFSPQGPVQGREVSYDARTEFGAYDRPVEGAIAVRWTGPACEAGRTLSVDGGGEVAFWAMPAGSTGPGRADLREWTLSNGQRYWSVADLSGIGATGGQAVASVWVPQTNANVPLSQYPLPERANAGPDRCAATSPITLDGTGSVLAQGIAEWQWTWDGGSAVGPEPLLTLPVGLTAITLTVSGPSGSASDTVTVQISHTQVPGEEF